MLNRDMSFLILSHLTGIEPTTNLSLLFYVVDRNQLFSIAWTGSPVQTSTVMRICAQERRKESLWFTRKMDVSMWWILAKNSQDNMPSCSCKDWKKWHLPCKHFFAVFRLKEAQWGWNALPQEYLNSAYLSTDNDATDAYFDYQQNVADEQHVLSPVQSAAPTHPVALPQQPIPGKVRNKLHNYNG